MLKTEFRKSLIDNEPEEYLYVKNKKSIRKFMKQKKRKFKREKIFERSQEIKRHIKVKENLKILNKYVRRMRAQSSGIYYRNSGYHDRPKNSNYKMYKDFPKSRTPKYSGFNSFNFKNILTNNDISSNPNLRIDADNDISKIDKINVDTSSTPQNDFYLEYFKILTGKNKNGSTNKNKEEY